ncbi:MAG: RtcB family protein [Candidatus Kapabacteria bacterium]|nr:RtcB family protein [Candidatus Kapabacteria bacterium]
MNTPFTATTNHAISHMNVGDGIEPITVIGTEDIRNGFDPTCLEQARNSRLAPGVSHLVLNPDAHGGYGAPIGCVLASPTHIYPGPVGVDIKCSMSLLQMDIPEEELRNKSVRRAIINAICERTPTGAGKGQRSVRKSRRVSRALGKQVALEGASFGVCDQLGIPPDWATKCEDAFHVGFDGTAGTLGERLDVLLASGLFPTFESKVEQLGSYGGGNHFGECEIVRIAEGAREQAVAETFGLMDRRAAFLSHCGSRGFGFQLANHQFNTLQTQFAAKGWAYPGNDKELVYAELGTNEANDYICDMSLGANFATVNHLLINALVLEAFQEVLPGTTGHLVYFISHNIARKEQVGNQEMWVHRKGATRAFPAQHEGLLNTPFYETGHPILLPGNPQDGSAVMVANPDAVQSLYSVNHGAGRAMGRRAAMRTLNQSDVDASFDTKDILTNCRTYPLDEAPAAYKDFSEVLRSVEEAGLATQVAKLKARFVIKDSDKSLRGAA